MDEPTEPEVVEPAPRFYTDPDDDRDILDAERPGWRLLFTSGDENQFLVDALNDGSISYARFFWRDDQGRLIAP